MEKDLTLALCSVKSPPGSHVFLFILFTSRFQRMERIARNGAADLQPGPPRRVEVVVVEQLAGRVSAAAAVSSACGLCIGGQEDKCDFYGQRHY
ncbi:hypothetical protein EYF80_022211 [Liparis tanakae]|uniref:Uncharacterized protein n=1 Tax=Liparis tanakae TaxID=230148 RepID=A0A4Z2HNZ5_9TELE|nr:hypothetical protein EYF80_022211 [Liparis tanakae]